MGTGIFPERKGDGDTPATAGAEWSEEEWEEWGLALDIVAGTRGGGVTPAPHDSERNVSDYEASHPAFLERLERSRKAVERVAEWARSGNPDIKIVIPETRSAPTRSVRKEYKDSGDIWIAGKQYEVKGLSVAFTSMGDWPFRNKFIVDGKYTFDRKDRLPAGYYIVDATLTHFAFVGVKETLPAWTVEKRLDGNTGREAEFYLCPVGLVMFGSFTREVFNAEDRGKSLERGEEDSSGWHTLS